MKSILKNFLFFSFLEPEQFEYISQYLDTFELNAGDILFEEGEDGDFVCFVLAGGLEVLKFDSWHYEANVIATAGQGNSIGEMALMDRAPRSATVRAVSDTHLAVLTQRAFDSLYDDEPKIAVNVLRGLILVMSENLRDTSIKLADELAA